MEKVVRKFKSHEEAEQADREFYRSLTGEQRLGILCEIVKRAHGDHPSSFPILSKGDLLRNKRTLGRPKDLADAAAIDDL